MTIDLAKLNKERKQIGSLTKKDHSKKTTVAGWVYEIRDLGKLRFLILRDISGEIQITAHKNKTDKKVFEKLGKYPKESVIAVSGKIQKSNKAPGERELVPESIEIIAKAEQPLPIDTSDFSKTDLPKRLDYRFLDFHRRRTQAIFKIQSTIIQSFREHFASKGFMEMQPPCIISSASEGGTELFSVKYFEKDAYLAQSPQLYKQMLACSIEKTYATVPVWRAEKHNTIRHINEIRQMDIEVGFAGQFEVMKHCADVVKYIVKKVIERNKEELNLLGIKLKIPKEKYLSYDETLEVLKKHKIKILHGEDLTPEAEKTLGEIYPDTVLLVHSWPAVLKPFYIMPKEEDPNAEYTEGFDALYKGLEIASGGQRIHLPDLLTKMLIKKGLNPKNFKSYIDSFRYGSPPHGGWSIGLERMTVLLTGQENIREGTMFPRDRDRLIP